MKNTKFELIFELGDGKYLAPQLLPVDEIPYEWRSNSNNLLFEFRYKFMPKGILTRTIVKRNADIYENTYWRYGVLLEYEGTRAIVRERYLENKIIIKLEGPNKKEFLAIIRKTIHEINSEYNNIEVHEMVPCNCIECKNKDPYFYKYNALRRYQQNERTEIVCEKSLTNINIKSIFSDSIFESYEINQNEIIDTKMTNINIKIDNTNNNNLTNKVNIEISNEIQISINGLIADCANLKEELLEVSSENDEEIIISEFNKIDTSLQNLNEAKNLDTIDKTKLSKLKLFIEKISNPSTKIGEVFKKVENGISTLQNIGKYYNSIAEWTGLPQIPSVFVK